MRRLFRVSISSATIHTRNVALTLLWRRSAQHTRKRRAVPPYALYPCIFVLSAFDSCNPLTVLRLNLLDFRDVFSKAPIIINTAVRSKCLALRVHVHCSRWTRTKRKEPGDCPLKITSWTARRLTCEVLAMCQGGPGILRRLWGIPTYRT